MMPDTFTALAPRPRRRLIAAFTGTFAGALAVGAVTAGLLIPPFASGDAAPPSLVVAHLDAAAARDDWSTAFALVDFEARGQALLPDLWAAAPASSRAAMVEFLKPIFQQTWTKAHSSAALQDGGHLETTLIGGGRVIVERVGADGEGEVALRHTLEPRGPSWRVVDRRSRTDTVVHDADLVIRSIRGRITGTLGREPNLEEFVANAPSWLGQVRSVKFRVGELPE